MKLLTAELFRHAGLEEKPIRLASAQDLSSFSYWTRGTIGEHLQFAARTVAQRTSPGQRQTIEQKGDNPFLVHVYVRTDGLAGVVIADKEYPLRVAFSFLNKVMSDFEKKYSDAWKKTEKDQTLTPEFLQQALSDFQDPKTADKLLKIQDTLEDIKSIMHKNIEDVLARGDTIDLISSKEIGRAVQQECRDRSRMPSSA
eukprot:TRINITY_DN9420_c0_g1_i5.p1 TRINITY_DN9420_c0_g1~~TRINITY_DN9420_c0_g1_i5.p1  ORF type:complete len:228 (+),score=51.51 TRINITY_DN9420_c0_g1_i5:88-684(+)